jgi:exodeoxyribonuclease V alpha subunit
MAETLAGMIERVTFHNADTGFAVLRVQTPVRRGLVTVVGTLPRVAAGEHLEATGSWVQDRDHGLQFKAEVLHTTPPHTSKGIERYLASGLVKGIGPHYAKRIVEAFGERTLAVIDESPAFLSEVRGLGPRRIQRIRESWRQQKAVRAIMVFLREHDIGPSRAVRIYKTYGDQAIELVRDNPYRLADDIWGIGFQTADQLAGKLGIERSSPLRARAALRHVLRQASDQGHCALPEHVLIEETIKLTRIDAALIAGALESAREEGDLVRDAVDGQPWIYSKPLFLAELNAARSIVKLLTGKHPLAGIDHDAAIGWVERKMHLKLAEEQREALRQALTRKVLIVTGGPGVGKTTIVRGIVEIFTAKRKTCMLAAPTGRAAQRLIETTRAEAMTIHRLLKYDPATSGFVHGRDKLLELDALIIDETSMVDIALFHQLLRAVPPEACLVLVGDRDQLPSVGPGMVLANLIDSGIVPVVRLTHIFRQAGQSWIVRAAHDVNHGQIPQSCPEPAGDFFFVEAANPSTIIERILTVVRERLPARFGFDPCRDVQVLTPMNRSELGARNLNVRLQSVLNPPRSRMDLERFGWSFRLGDKVIQTVNNYTREVFNGDIGRVQAMDFEEQEIAIDFDGRQVMYDFSDLDELAPAYALTIHKSQGSEYPAVVIPLHPQHSVMLQRNLLYTAVTRGKRIVVLVGNRRALALAVKRQDTSRRYTALARRLREFSTKPQAP